MTQSTGILDRSARSAVAPAALLAMLVGAFLVFGAGFASPDALHDAAHDARHTINTPCH